MVPELADRFLGLNGEPKMYGRNSALAYAIILLYYLRVEKSNRLVFFIIVNILGVILSLSASTIILFAFLSIYILFISGKIKGVLVILAVTPIAYFILSSSTFFVEVTKSKIEKALLGVNNEIIPGEPKFFTRFDVFDRLALVYLYENPQYIITGVGPNLISLPASQYVNSLPEYTTFAERGGIDSVPNVMVNNVLARSGLIGVLMYIFFFKRLYRLSLRDKTGFSKGLVVISIAFNMVYFSVVLCFITGIVVAINIRRHINLRDT
ncbi:MAG: hypothetical protein EOO89_24500 [Pedobacter sp.]|nr:MAG: hypothetical protein EOO89_24500 [Pedobacter sp.]